MSSESGAQKLEFYVNPDLEIRPMVVVRLDEESSSGGAYFMGDGLDRELREELKVNRKIAIKTVCGGWTWHADGQYEMIMKTKRSSIILLYHARLRGKSQGAFT